MIKFKAFLEEMLKEEVAANCMGGGQVATFDPVLFKKVLRRNTKKSGQ